MFRCFHEPIEAGPSESGWEYRRLWAAVINQAVDDIKGVPDWADKNSIHYKVLRGEQARAWLKSKRTDPGAFLWICDTLKLDPKPIRDVVLSIREGVSREIAVAHSPRPTSMADRRPVPAV